MWRVLSNIGSTLIFKRTPTAKFQPSSLFCTALCNSLIISWGWEVSPSLGAWLVSWVSQLHTTWMNLPEHLSSAIRHTENQCFLFGESTQTLPLGSGKRVNYVFSFLINISHRPRNESLASPFLLPTRTPGLQDFRLKMYRWSLTQWFPWSCLFTP